MKNPSLTKTYWINNAIALAVYALIVAIPLFYPYTLAYVFQWPDNAENILFFAGILLCIVCGFFLKPTKELSFMSVISVGFAMVIIFIIDIVSSMPHGEFIGFGYIAYNPICAKLLFLNLPGMLMNTVILYSSPWFPSLLMYAGILLRKCVKR